MLPSKLSANDSALLASSDLPFLPDDICARCSRDLDFEDGNLVQHRCCTCVDAGRVRLPFRVGEPGFGTTIPCPDCHGRKPGVVEDVGARMRIPMLHRRCIIETWEPENGRPRRLAEEYVRQWPPAKPLFLMTGEKGAGKTHLAAAVLRRIFEEHGKRGQFWPVIDLLDRYRATFDGERATETVEAIDQELRRVEVLVLDDFGANKATEWVEERLFRVVDERYRDMRPLVVTSNVGLLGLPDRVKSRFTDASVAQIAIFDGPDMRPRQ